MSEKTKIKSRTQEKIKIQKPSMYKVIMHNDDYSTMDFVIIILIEIFQKDETNAYNIMMDIHQKGSGLCGIYSKEIAETKVTKVHKRAQNEGFPLRCSFEKV